MELVRTAALCILLGVMFMNCVDASEPTAEVANSWWPALRNVWTPIGWKDHLFRFCVLYNGTVMADPNAGFPTKHREKYAGLGVQLTFTPSADGSFPTRPSQEPYQLSDTPDGGVGNQGWTENPAPVLWTEWPCTHMYGLDSLSQKVRAQMQLLPAADEHVKAGRDGALVLSCRNRHEGQVCIGISLVFLLRPLILAEIRPNRYWVSRLALAPFVPAFGRILVN